MQFLQNYNPPLYPILPHTWGNPMKECPLFILFSLALPPLHYFPLDLSLSGGTGWNEMITSTPSWLILAQYCWGSTSALNNSSPSKGCLIQMFHSVVLIRMIGTPWSLVLHISYSPPSHLVNCGALLALLGVNDCCLFLKYSLTLIMLHFWEHI